MSLYKYVCVLQLYLRVYCIKQNRKILENNLFLIREFTGTLDMYNRSLEVLNDCSNKRR